jgi:hypothetical protein
VQVRRDRRTRSSPSSAVVLPNLLVSPLASIVGFASFMSANVRPAARTKNPIDHRLQEENPHRAAPGNHGVERMGAARASTPESGSQPTALGLIPALGVHPREGADGREGPRFTHRTAANRRTPREGFPPRRRRPAGFSRSRVGPMFVGRTERQVTAMTRRESPITSWPTRSPFPAGRTPICGSPNRPSMLSSPRRYVTAVPSGCPASPVHDTAASPGAYGAESCSTGVSWCRASPAAAVPARVTWPPDVPAGSQEGGDSPRREVRTAAARRPPQLHVEGQPEAHLPHHTKTRSAPRPSAGSVDDD